MEYKELAKTAKSSADGIGPSFGKGMIYATLAAAEAVMYLARALKQTGLELPDAVCKAGSGYKDE